MPKVAYGICLASHILFGVSVVLVRGNSRLNKRCVGSRFSAMYDDGWCSHFTSAKLVCFTAKYFEHIFNGVNSEFIRLHLRFWGRIELLNQIRESSCKCEAPKAKYPSHRLKWRNTAYDKKISTDASSTLYLQRCRSGKSNAIDSPDSADTILFNKAYSERNVAKYRLLHRPWAQKFWDTVLRFYQHSVKSVNTRYSAKWFINSTFSSGKLCCAKSIIDHKVAIECVGYFSATKLSRTTPTHYCSLSDLILSLRCKRFAEKPAKRSFKLILLCSRS